jgi:hypothetical protein
MSQFWLGYWSGIGTIIGINALAVLAFMAWIKWSGK